MHDLASLARAIPTGQPVNWVFPNGPLAIPIGGHHEGRAWFPLPIADIQKALAEGGEGFDFAQLVPPGMKRAREAVSEMLGEIGAPMDRVVLGGFSQGAILATEITLRAKVPPAGLGILSGTLVNADGWRELAAARKGFRFFQSHGTYDSVLQVDPAVRLERLLIEAGWKGRLLRFEGHHEIPLEVISAFGQYLREVLPG